MFVDRSVDLRRLERQERRLRLQNDTLLSRILQLDSSRAYDAWSSDDLSGASSGEDDDAGEVFVEPTPQKDFRGHSFPIHVENSGSAQLKVYSLGRVVHDRDAFHTPKHIWPVSYVCTRRYVSMKNPKRTTTYKCEIYDGGDAPMVRTVYLTASRGLMCLRSFGSRQRTTSSTRSRRSHRQQHGKVRYNKRTLIFCL